MTRIGVLALQGAFQKHIEKLIALGVDHQEVRSNSDLKACDGLIIPGGESTTMAKLLKEFEMLENLYDFAESRPLFGTCAGLILMAKDVLEDPITPLGFLDIAIERNAYGRQVDSFEGLLQLSLPAKTQVCGTFIRAPRIAHVEDSVRVLASWEGHPVLVQQGHHLGASFHPELSDNLTIHQHFLDLVQSSRC